MRWHRSGECRKFRRSALLLQDQCSVGLLLACVRRPPAKCLCSALQRGARREGKTLPATAGRGTLRSLLVAKRVPLTSAAFLWGHSRCPAIKRSSGSNHFSLTTKCDFANARCLIIPSSLRLGHGHCLIVSLNSGKRHLKSI